MVVDTMREGPPPPSSASASTSTLLKEISSLRLKLKELEDDNKSCVSSAAGDTQLINMLKKDVARYEQEKAQLEREFMNQLSKQSMEHKVKMDALKAKMAQAEESSREKLDELAEKFEEAESSQQDLQKKLSEDKSEKYLLLLEEERDSHAEEIEQMKRTLAQTDLEMVESRREMDRLQDQLLERELNEESLMEEVKSLQASLSDDKSSKLVEKEKAKIAKLTKDIENKDKELAKCAEEMGEMNDTIIKLEQHKKMLVSEVTDVRMQLDRIEDENQTLKSDSSTARSSQAVMSRPSASNEETQQLENSVLELEGRVEKFTKKLQDKDAKLEKIVAALTESRKTNKSLKDQLASLQVTQVQSSDISVDASDMSYEISRLREENKSLSSELSELRTKASSPSRNGHTRPDASPGMSMPTSNRKKAERPKSSPRQLATIPDTPSGVAGISSIVANFERRIAGQCASLPVQSSDDETSIEAFSPRSLVNASHEKEETVALEEFNGLQNELENERNAAAENVERVQRELDHEHLVVEELRRELEVERLSVEDLRSRLDNVTIRKPARPNKDLEQRLEESQKEVDRLVERVKESEDVRSRLQEALAVEKTQVSNLRNKLDEMTMEQCDLEKSHAELTTEMRQSKIKVVDLEKNFAEQTAEKEELDDRLMKSEIELKSIRIELQHCKTQAFEEEKKEEATEEELGRLRSQVATLQPEYERSLAEVATLQGVVKSMQTTLSKRVENDSKFVALKEELSKSQMDKAGVELEYTNKIAELENELEVIELAAEEELEDKEAELDKVKAELAKQEKQTKKYEEEVARLEIERTQLCSSMNDASMSRKDELEETQAELMDMTAKAKSQAREIQSLKQKLDDRSKSESIKSLKLRVKELEEEIHQLKWDARNNMTLEDSDKIRHENGLLRQANRQLKLDRNSLNERLNSILTDKTSSRSARVLRDRNNALKGEVERLTTRIHRLEESISRYAV